MVLVIDDRFWGLQDTPLNQGVSAPLIGTKSKLCPDCDAGNIQNLSTERPFPQRPILTESNRMDNPSGDEINGGPKDRPMASDQQQLSAGGGSNNESCLMRGTAADGSGGGMSCPSTTGGKSLGHTDPPKQAGSQTETIIGLGIIVAVIATAIWALLRVAK